ncbi:MFS transporter [Inquilinus limosus]|uniref:MFS transporter n=1 Tax=Inquilinus limosus TaxID=171674 RepID=UPI000403B8FC|nr:MFS transporter [Inquilinus limosus]
MSDGATGEAEARPDHGRLRAIAALSAHYGVSGILTPYLPVWLAASGLAADAVGWTVAAGFALRAVCILGFGMIATLLLPAGGLSAGAALAAGAVLIAAALIGDPGAAGLLSVLAVGLVYGSIPLIESFANTVALRGSHGYGRMRAWGSFAFLVGNVGMGALLVLPDGVGLLPYITAGLLICLSLSVLGPSWQPPAPRLDPRAAAAALAVAAPLLIPALLLQASHAFYYSFGTIWWIDHGVDKGSTGLVWGAAVAAEVLVYRYAARRLERVPPAALLAACCLVAIGRWLLLALDPPLPLIILSQFGHAMTFGGAYLVAQTVIRTRIRPELHYMAQAGYAFLTTFVGLAGTTALIPWALRITGADPWLLMATIATAALAWLGLARLIGPRQVPAP